MLGLSLKDSRDQRTAQANGQIRDILCALDPQYEIAVRDGGFSVRWNSARHCWTLRIQEGTIWTADARSIDEVVELLLFGAATADWRIQDAA